MSPVLCLGRLRERLAATFGVAPVMLAVLVMLAATPAAAEVAALDDEALEALDAWIERERERWNIPGLAVAIVHEDTLVHARGYGSTRLEGGRDVDTDTQFGIASLSKAMTATALGLLVDEGLLDWDDPVVEHLPAFRLSDDHITAMVTVRDLLSHRVGVGRLTGNRLTFMPARSRAEVLPRLRHHEFERPFREGYVYSNMMYTVAGELVEALTGEPWERYLVSRLFAPLGMTRSHTTLGALDANAVYPHQEIDGELVEIERRDWGYAAPAASVNSTMHDLARWMRFNLGERGVLDGERLVSVSTMRDIHRPSNLSGYDRDERVVGAYGLGWNIGRYRDHEVLSHGGATDGINSLVWLVPELELGIVFSANRFTQLGVPLMRHVVDLYTGHEPTRWSTREHARFEQRRKEAREARAKVHAARDADAPKRHARGAYVGRYHDPLYDSVEVLDTGDGLALRFWDDDTQVLDLEHWHHDTFRGHWRNRAQREKFAWFTMGEDGKPEVLHVRFTLRPEVLEEGIYPAGYTRTVRFVRE